MELTALSAQVIVDIIGLVAGGALGWLMKIVWSSVERLQANQRDIEADLHTNYVRKSELKESLDRIESMLTRIFDKLDGKQDKRVAAKR